ncbi:NAD binding domain of 6-phosphogluconate dehydrogenase-domain-containing protein [Mycena amicta]|nr:NAD binding domain of 6-phosphogluconate dehydrogenase-domain-containing protein [Mycena amicta]
MLDVQFSVVPHDFGWIGLGAMGWPMAKQLLAKNTAATLTVYDVDQSVLEKFAREEPERIKIASSAKQVADKADWVFTIVPEGRHVREVYLTAETGVLAADIAGKTFIDCSTIDIATSLEIGEAITASGSAFFLDAPVSGGTARAAKGTITFMVGMAAEDSNFPLIRAVLSTMGTTNAMGGSGRGLAAKLCNNYLSGCIAIATSEAMSLGMKLGIDAKVLSETFEKGTGANWVNAFMNPVPGVCADAATSKGYVGGFKVELMEKDMRLATQIAQEANVKLVLGDAAVSAYSQTASNPEYKGKDSRVVYQWLNQL